MAPGSLWKAPWNPIDDVITWNYYKFLLDADGRFVRAYASNQPPEEAEPLIRSLLGLGDEDAAASGGEAEPESEPEPEAEAK